MSAPTRLTVALAVTWSLLAVPAATASTSASTYVAVVENDGGDLSVHQFSSSPQQMTGRLQELHDDGTVVSLDIDRPVRALGTVDPYRAKQWALDRVSFEASWPLTNGTGAVVAVLDTGVQADHEDLAGSVLTGWDAIANRSGAKTDPSGHGTHVAGIIAAVAGNGKGIAGAAPGVRILPVRVLDRDGAGYLSDILEGIIWAADHGADVINLSLGGDGNDTTYAAVIRYALDKGSLVVASAGNDGLDGNTPTYPAADPGAIAVSATTASDTRASFSNYGSYVDIAAPGAGIYSTIPTGYASASGTSMAAPYASAAAAVLAAHDLDLPPSDVRDLLERSAIDLGAAGRDDHFGAGLIDPGAALTLSLSVSLPPPPALLEPALVAPAPAPTAPAPAAPAPAVTEPAVPEPPAPEPIASEPAAPTPETAGYWVVAANGRVHPFGSAPFLGDASRLPLTAAVVAAAVTPTGRGYWLTTADGAVFAFGDASLHGSTQALRLNAPIVGITATATGRGYWLLGRDGGIFSFGDAAFYGSTGGMTLNQPVVDMAATPSGRGYWLVATDGGVFSFGDARFHGSTGAIRLNRPVVSLTPSTDGGYWMVATDGGIFAFDVPFHGSLPGLAQAGLPDGHRVRATPGGNGYFILGASGRVFPFGAARDYGSPLPHPVADLILSPSASTTGH